MIHHSVVAGKTRNHATTTLALPCLLATLTLGSSIFTSSIASISGIASVSGGCTISTIPTVTAVECVGTVAFTNAELQRKLDQTWGTQK